MRVNLAQLMAEYELERFPQLVGWKVEMNRRRRRVLGRCVYKTKTIELSVQFVEANEVERVRQTVLHEIAHALTPGHGHDQVWKAQARKLGIPDDRCSSDVVSAVGKYKSSCAGCSKTYYLYRRPNPRKCYRCRTCKTELCFS